MSVQRTLRETIKNSGRTGATISRDTGVPEAVVSRFVRGVTELSGRHIDTLADYFGLSLLPPRPANTKHRTGGKPPAKDK